MSRLTWDRSKAIGMMVLLVAFGIVQACVQKTETAEDRSVRDKTYATRLAPIIQRNLDQASLLCRDGIVYLGGYVDRSMFLSPYIKDGHYVSCVNGQYRVIDVEAQKKESP